jgi:hypothetical protein
MKITELADQVLNIPLREVLERYGFEAKREGTTLRAKSEHHNVVVTGSRWFDNKAGVGGGGAIDLVIHLTKVNFSVACRSLADEFLPLASGQTALSFPKRWQEPSPAHSFRPRPAAPTPGSGWNESAAGPPEPPTRHLKRLRLS